MTRGPNANSRKKEGPFIAPTLSEQHPDRLDRLDHLRAFAALLVLIWHGASTPSERAHPLLALLQEGHTGVSLFCVVSGFILSYLYIDNTISYGEFMRRRAYRVVPLLALYTALAYFTSDQSLADLVSQCLLVPRHDTALQPITGQNWSVFVELQFYFIVPFILIFVRTYGVIYLFGLIGLAIVLRLGIYLNQGDVLSPAYWTIFGRIDQFLWGAVAGVMLRRGVLSQATRPRVAWLNFTTAACAAMLWAFLYRLSGGFDGATVRYDLHQALWIIIPSIEGVIWAAVTVCYLALPKSGTFRFWTLFGSGVAFLGRISYSLYLNQLMVLGALRAYKLDGLFGPSWRDRVWMTFCLALPILIALSIVTYRLVERPFIAFKAARSAASQA